MKSRNVISLIIVLLIILWFVMPHFLRMALIYQKPGIDDYKLFSNRIVNNDNYIQIPKSGLYSDHILLDSVENYFNKSKTSAFVVVKNDSIIYERYWDKFADTTLSNSFSMAKSIIGLLTGIAIDEGYIKSANQPVSDFLPGFNENYKSMLTVGHLLTMSAALDWNETYTSAISVTTQAYYGENIDYLLHDTHLKSEPGKEFEYQSGTTQLLAMVLAKATGKSVSEYASEKLWKKIGAEYPALWSLDKEEGTEKAFCCFNAIARDFARLGILVLHRGKFAGKTVISDTMMAKILTPAIWLSYKSQPVDFYGWQWWIGTYKGQKMYYARGILGQYIIVIPDDQLVVVRLGHKRDLKRRGIHPDDIFHYLDAAYQSITI